MQFQREGKRALRGVEIRVERQTSCMPPFPIHPLLYSVALHGVGVVRESVPDAHGLPQAVVLEQLVPVSADTGSAPERAGVVDEAEDV